MNILEKSIPIGNNLPITKTLRIIKTGNLIRISIDGNTYADTFANNQGYSLLLNSVGVKKSPVTSISINKAYSFS